MGSKLQPQGHSERLLQVERPYDQMTGPQLLELAKELGYLVTRDANGKWAIVDRNSLKRLNKQELLLELKGEKEV
jgi:hypothetical protein